MSANSVSPGPHPFAHRPQAITVVQRLHELSLKQEQAASLRHKHFPNQPGDQSAFVDQLVALDEDKAKVMYTILRSTGASRVVEAGTSFGVSLIYLLAAVLDNEPGRTSNYPPLVVGTESEPSKAAKALEHVDEAFGSVPSVLHLAQGDLLVTLPALNLPDGSLDALLLDIWAPIALPTLKILLPKFRKGAVVFIDNTGTDVAADRYAELLGFLKDVKNGFISTTLPFSGGFEMCVYTGY